MVKNESSATFSLFYFRPVHICRTLPDKTNLYLLLMATRWVDDGKGFDIRSFVEVQLEKR